LLSKLDTLASSKGDDETKYKELVSKLEDFTSTKSDNSLDQDSLFTKLSESLTNLYLFS